MSRRRARWILRSAYVAVLFGLLGVQWQGLARLGDHSITVRAIQDWLGTFHGSLAICQLLAAVLLGPVFAASLMHEERTGRTLLLVLASRITTAEWLTGKLAAALLRVCDVCLGGVPLLSVGIVLGATSLQTVLADLVLAVSAALAGGAFALLVATWFRRFTDSLLLTYLIQGLWYSLPSLNFISVLIGRWPAVPSGLLRLNALRAITQLAAGSPGLGWDVWAWPAATMLVFAAVCWTVAVLTVRHASCRVEFGVERQPLIGRRRWRLFAAPQSRPVGDRPLLWRELSCRRTTLIERLAWAIFLAAGITVVSLVVREWPSSARIVFTSPAPGTGPPPRVCIISGAATFCHLAFFAFPFLAVAASAAFADEREGGIYELLRMTDLTPSEFVHAKLARLALLLIILLMPPLLLTGVMVAIGYSTWIGFGLVALNSLASLSFAALFGMSIGMRSHKTSHAVAMTIALGLVGGFLIPFLSLLSVSSGPTVVQYLLATGSPPLQCFFLMMFDTVHGGGLPVGTISMIAMRLGALMWALAYGLTGVALYLSLLRVRMRVDWGEGCEH